MKKILPSIILSPTFSFPISGKIAFCVCSLELSAVEVCSKIVWSNRSDSVVNIS